MTSSSEPFCLRANPRSFLWQMGWWGRALAYKSAADFRGKESCCELSCSWLGGKGNLCPYSQRTGLGTYLFSPSYSNLILTLRCWKQKQRMVRSQTASWIDSQIQSWQEFSRRLSQLCKASGLFRPSCLVDSQPLGTLHIVEECACQKVSSSVSKKTLTSTNVSFNKMHS